MLWFFLFILWILNIVFCAWLAGEKNRDKENWAALAFLFFFGATVAIIAAPKKEKSPGNENNEIMPVELVPQAGKVTLKTKTGYKYLAIACIIVIVLLVLGLSGVFRSNSNPESRKYFSEVKNIIESTSVISSEISTFLSRPAPSDPTWRNELRKREEIFAYDLPTKIKEIIPPESFTLAHRYITKALEAQAQGATAVIGWLDRGAPQIEQSKVMNVATDKALEATGYINFAEKELKSLLR